MLNLIFTVFTSHILSALVILNSSHLNPFFTLHLFFQWQIFPCSPCSQNCNIPVLRDSLSSVLSPPLSPPLHSPPSTGCICCEHAQFTFLIRCSGPVMDTQWRLIKYMCVCACVCMVVVVGGAWFQVLIKIINGSIMYLHILRWLKGP